jgi:hypothetical protein
MGIVLTLDAFRDLGAEEEEVVPPFARWDPIDFIPGSFRFTDDYGTSRAELIAAGNYDGVYLEPFSKWPNLDEGGAINFEARYFPLAGFSSRGAVRYTRRLDDGRWEPARLEHMLAFGALFPEEQLKQRIVGLGSVAMSGGDLLVPILSGSPETPSRRRFFGLSVTPAIASWRRISTTIWDGVWNYEYQALMVRSLAQ